MNRRFSIILKHPGVSDTEVEDSKKVLAYARSAGFRNFMSLGVDGTRKKDTRPTTTVNVPS